MVSITLSVSEQIRAIMRSHDEINWSGFVRKAVEKKAQDLKSIEFLKDRLKKERPTTQWAVQLQRAARQGRIETLKRKGLI